MSDSSKDFVEQYRSLVETTCEWRAYQLDDPAAMADRVFASLQTKPGPPTLRLLFRVIPDVVSEAYLHQVNQRSLTEGLVQGLAHSWLSRPRTGTDSAMATLGSLSYADGALVRQVLWDDLTFDEMAEINGGDAARQQQRYTTALARFTAKLPAGTTDDPTEIIRQLQPGTHRRYPATDLDVSQ